MQNQTKPYRIFGLDLMRATAILMVLFGHCLWIFPESNSFIHQLLLLCGFLGVELFFVLSGFLIGKIIYTHYIKENFGVSSLLTFLKRRWYRTLPNYFLVLLLVLTVVYFFGHIPSYSWKYFFFLQNFNSTMPRFFPESWSLSVEEFAYVFFPFILLLSTRFFKPKNKPQFFLIIILIMIAVFGATKIYYQLTTTNISLQQWNLALKAVVIYRLDSK